MGLLTALGHLLNFIAPALGMAVIGSVLVKLVWHRAMRRVGWAGLLVWSAAVGALVLFGGLLLFGRDGAMATYAALVLATACVFWWKGLRQT